MNPSPTVTAPGDQTVCNGASTAAVSFSGTGTSYTWVNDTTSIGLAASGSGDIGSFNGSNSGTTPVTATITVTPHYTNGGVTCDGSPESFKITVNPFRRWHRPPIRQCATGPRQRWRALRDRDELHLGERYTGHWAGGQRDRKHRELQWVNGGSTPVTATITVTPHYDNGGPTALGRRRALRSR